MGMELSPQKRLLVTRSAPVFEAELESKSEIITEEVNSPRQSRNKSGTTSYNEVVGGKLQQIIFSKELAKEGIINLIDLSERDTENSPLALVVVVNGSTHELFEKTNQLPDKPAPGFYINRLLEHNIKADIIPESRVHNFCIAYFAPGIDPIAPLIEFEEENTKGVKVIGSALFSDDKLVGEIDTDSTAELLAMMGKMRKSQYLFNTSKLCQESKEPKISSSFSIHSVKRKIKVSIEDHIPKVDIFLNMNGNVEELYWDGIKDKNDKEKIEKCVGEEFARQCVKVLKYTQETGSDPIGIGSLLRAKYGTEWKEDAWKETYKNAEFNVKVNYTIKHHGIIK
jgi:spore germination protein